MAAKWGQEIKISERKLAIIRLINRLYRWEAIISGLCLVTCVTMSIFWTSLQKFEPFRVFVAYVLFSVWRASGFVGKVLHEETFKQYVCS